MIDLVSICLLTYNSGKYILDTLDSILLQNYKNIELIISDDASSDNTLTLVQDWCNKNSGHFNRIKILRNTKNNGTSTNCNIAIRHSCGKWIKILAGDDILLPNYITSNIEYIKSHPEEDIKVLQSSNKYINEDNEVLPLMQYSMPDYFCHQSITAELQHEILLYTYISNTISAFISKEAIKAIGKLDDSISLMEDYQLWLKLTLSGYKIHYMDTVTCLYRIHSHSISQHLSHQYLFPPIWKYTLMTREKLIYPYLTNIGKLIFKSNSAIFKRLLISSYNRPQPLYKLIWGILNAPYRIYCKYKIKKIITLSNVSTN